MLPFSRIKTQTLVMHTEQCVNLLQFRTRRKQFPRRIALIGALLVAGVVRPPGVQSAQIGTVASWGEQVLPYVEPETRFSKIAAGGYHSLGLKQDGTVVEWGSFDPVPSGLGSVIAIAAGYRHCVALKQDGNVVPWGENYFDQTEIPSDLTGVIEITAGGEHSLALKQDGTVV